jgi:HAD superfamily hydrolase (TIGR01509 family)
VEFVHACRARGLKTAVATSADRVKLEGNLREIGLPADRFDACITGDDIVRKKPDPEIFLKAAAAVGLPAGRCVVVEDAPNGIRAAKAAGAGCIGVTSSFPAERLREAGADPIATDMHGAWRAIEAWAAGVS